MAFRSAVCACGVAMGLSWGIPAAAYCVARSCDPDAVGGHDCELDRESGCSVEGIELTRPDGCIDIGVVRGTAASTLGLSDRRLEMLILEAFAMWSSVDCGEGRPSIRVQSVGAVEARARHACDLVPERNLDLWSVSDELTGSEAVTATSGATAGVTYSTFDLESGRVFDADVALNELWLLIQDEAALEAHFRVIAAHEAGHALGLAHATDRDALMYKSYAVDASRAPTEDDIRGICELYPPGANLDCEAPRIDPAALEPAACEEAFGSEISDQGSDSSGCAVADPSAVANQRVLAASSMLTLAAIHVLRRRRPPIIG